MNNENTTVGQYLVDRLSELGLGHLFSIAGDYSLEWVNNYVDVEGSGIKLIEEVNELNAGYAADGYARVKGIGALCVTYSAGALSAVNAIAGAYVEKVPVVLINGAPSIKRTLTFEQTGFSAHHFISGRETDLQVFEPITIAAIRIDNPDLAPMLIDYALTQCITERRPVYIELLEDMVNLSCDAPKRCLKPARTLPDNQSLEQAIKKIKERLQGATNPLLWIGVEIGRFGLQEKAKVLIKKLNLPYVTQFLSKSILSEDDELFAGVFDGPASVKVVNDLAKKSDFILALGVWLTDLNMLGLNPNSPDWSVDFNKTAFASWDTIKFGTNFWPQVPLENLLDGLLAEVMTCKAQPPLAKAISKATAINLADEISYQGFYDFISGHIDENAIIDENTIIGADASMNYFGSLLLKVTTPGGFFAQSSYSSIGYMGPAATGICLAKNSDQRVLVFMGDGGFQMTAQCLSTQTRFGLNPIIFVIDNGVYAVEQWLADASVFSDPDKNFVKSCNVHRWNYSKLAEVFGCQGWKASNYSELKAAVKEAIEKLDENKPSIIQVMLPAKSTPDNSKWKIN